MKQEKLNWPAVASFLLPGLGQVAKGEFIEGYAYGFVWSLFLTLTITVTAWFGILALLLHVYCMKSLAGDDKK